ncbi:MAG: PEFG-CTERM sorting domain-containing protein [Thaumarchaeota archaeon]|nr:PEFG-CTERM sorting domain-containing protein [Nitrososphaerota archaeon]MBI3642056.1 PEFG-CTERM sorting domain-containing protein [Nitrososphaerota archaeon]
MKSKLIGSLFVVLTLVVGIMAFAPSAFADTSVSMTKGSSSGQACVAASNCFDPANAQVAPGDTVTWTNDDTASHTVTSGNPNDNQTGTVFDSTLVKAGGTFAFKFTDAGTYNYFCQVHPWMTGMVTVGAATPPPATTDNNAVPEFGSIASLILVIAIVSVIAVTAKTRGFLKL